MNEPFERDDPPKCPEHGLRQGVQTRDFCDVVDDFGHCGRFLLYEPELSQVRLTTAG